MVTDKRDSKDVQGYLANDLKDGLGLESYDSDLKLKINLPWTESFLSEELVSSLKQQSNHHEKSFFAPKGLSVGNSTASNSSVSKKPLSSSGSTCFSYVFEGDDDLRELPGEKIEMTEIKFTGESIGQGAFGSVVKATYKNKVYAAKIFEPSKKSYFEAEWRRIYNVSHSNIVKVYWYFEYGYIMELMKGDLTDFVNKRLRYGEILDIFLQISSGLEHLHSLRICHNDLKPANILFKMDEKNKYIVKISDFGAAKFDKSQSVSKESEGNKQFSEYFVSPERKDSKKYTLKSDVYSLGKICHLMLHQRGPLPSPESTLMKFLKSCMEDDYEMRPRSSKVKSFFQGLLQKHKSKKDYK